MSSGLHFAYIDAYSSFTSDEHWLHARSNSIWKLSISDVWKKAGSTADTLHPNGFIERLHKQSYSISYVLSREDISHYT